MSKHDLFTESLKADLRSRNITQAQAADKAKKSFRQFKRELYGDTSQGMMSLETLAELKKEGAISDNTIEVWWQTKRMILRLKKKRPPFWKRSLKNA